MTAQETVNEVYATAQMIAQVAFSEAVERDGDMDIARDLIWEQCDGTQDVIYYGKAANVVAAFGEDGLGWQVLMRADSELQNSDYQYESYSDLCVALSFYVHVQLAYDALAAIEEAAA